MSFRRALWPSLALSLLAAGAARGQSAPALSEETPSQAASPSLQSREGAQAAPSTPQPLPGPRYALVAPALAASRLAALDDERPPVVGSSSSASSRAENGKLLLGIGCSVAGVGVLMVIGVGIGYTLKEGLKCGLGEHCGSTQPLSLSNGYGQAMLAGGLLGVAGLGLCITGGVLVGTASSRSHASLGAVQLARAGSGGVWLTPHGLAF